MSLADELLADLEDIGNDFDDEEIKIKEEPIDEGGNAQDADELMEIDESVWNSVLTYYEKIDMN